MAKIKDISIISLIAVILLAGLAFLSKTNIAEAQSSDMSFVILPDIQYSSPEVVDSICQWVSGHQMSQNIKALISVGDLTQSAKDSEFERLLPCFNQLNNLGIIVLPVIGNHDYTNLNSRSTTKFDKYFGPTYFKSKSWYGGNYDNSNANYYAKFTVGDRKFLIMALEFFPRAKVISWASSILDSHADYEVIITTHGYLNPDGSRTTDSGAYGPSNYGLPASDNSGEDLWNSLIKKKPNIKFVVSGHQLGGNIAKRSDTGNNGNLVNQMFTNWQDSPNGGDGWISLLQMNPASISIDHIKTYNPENKITNQISNIVCSTEWNAPTKNINSKQYGVRNLGEASNVKISISGLAPNSTFMTRNTHSDGTYIQWGPVDSVRTDSKGNREIRDSTPIKSDDGYKAGTYISTLRDPSNPAKIIADCGGFVVSDTIEFKASNSQRTYESYEIKKAGPKKPEYKSKSQPQTNKNSSENKPRYRTNKSQSSK